MAIDDKLHQMAEYRAAVRGAEHTVMDDRGQITYGPPVAIPCRRRYKLTETLTAEGQIIRGEWIYRTAQKITVDDSLDTRRVQFVQEMILPDGSIYGYKVVC